MNLDEQIKKLKRQCHKCETKVRCYCKLRPMMHEDDGLVLLCVKCKKELE